MSRKTPIPLALLVAATMATTTFGQAYATPSAADDVRVSFAKKENGHLRIQSVTTRSQSEANRTMIAKQREAGVVATSVDRRVHATKLDPKLPEQYGLNLLQATRTWSYPDANGTIVAVIDSGVDGNHPDLRGNVLQGAEFLRGGDPRSTGNGWNTQHFHGTAVAGSVGATVGNGVGVAGLARNVRILPVRTLDTTGSGYGSDLAISIVWAVDHGAKVINLSLGAPSPSTVEQAAVDYALSKDVVVVASAGNSGDAGNPVVYPAAYPGVIGVGAYDSTRTVASFSERGSFVDLTAPGVGIPVILPGGRYGVASGTSFSAPRVSAAAALVRGNAPAMSASAVEDLLTRTATDLGAPGRDTSYGAGSVNPSAALATVSRPVKPQLAMTAPRSAMVGSTQRFTAQATWVGEGTYIYLQEYRSRRWVTIRQTRASWIGAAAFNVSLPATGATGRYRLSSAGKATVSTYVRLTPAPARRVSTGAPRSTRSRSVPVWVKMTGGRTVSRVPVTLYYLAPGSRTWRTAGKWPTDSAGRLRVVVSVSGRGTWRFKTSAPSAKASNTVNVQY